MDTKKTLTMEVPAVEKATKCMSATQSNESSRCKGRVNKKRALNSDKSNMKPKKKEEAVLHFRLWQAYREAESVCTSIERNLVQVHRNKNRSYL